MIETSFFQQTYILLCCTAALCCLEVNTLCVMYIAPLFLLFLIQHKITREPVVWFMFQKTKYTLSSEGVFQPLEFPVNKLFAHYHKWQGYGEESEVAAVRMTFGKNRSTFPPSTLPLLLSPSHLALVLIQRHCRTLSVF